MTRQSKGSESLQTLVEEKSVDANVPYVDDSFEAGSKIKLLFMEQYVPESNLENFVKASKTKVIAFKFADEDLHPCLLSYEHGTLICVALDEQDMSNAHYLTDRSENVVTLIPYIHTTAL